MAEKKTTPLVALSAVLPVNTPDGSRTTPLETLQQLHAALDRANIRHLELIDEPRTLKASWAKRNVLAAQCRQSIPSAEIKHVDAQRRDLQSALMETQSEIGCLSKSIREHKAARQAVGQRAQGEEAPPRRLPQDEFPAYFMPVARDELAPELHAQIERVAQALQHDAKRNGVTN